MVPALAIVRVGERPEDLSYERGAVKRCEEVGIAVKRFILSEDASQEELTALLRQINGAPDIHGCLLFRPLPRHMDEGAVCAALSPAKDVDGITPGSLASVFSGDRQGYPPCTAQACMELLDYYGYDLTWQAGGGGWPQPGDRQTGGHAAAGAQRHRHPLPHPHRRSGRRVPPGGGAHRRRRKGKG